MTTEEVLTSGGVVATSGSAAPEEVMDFLRTTIFTGYQAVPLPHGARVPGDERGASIDAVLAGVEPGCSLLDIGTYYGRYCIEARARGADRVVGVEADPERFEVAARIAELHGNQYEVLAGRIEEVRLDERFDHVLLLNVLHHVTDPVALVRRAAELSQGEVIVEFPTAEHHGYIAHTLSRGGAPRRHHEMAARVCSWGLRLSGRWLPLMAVGPEPYHRTFYFNPSAFRNLFTVHHPVFDDITFLRSPDWPSRCLARCRVRR